MKKIRVEKNQNFKLLPTIKSEHCSLKSFFEEIQDMLKSDINYDSLTIYEYSVSLKGWNLLRKNIVDWMEKKKSRKVIAYIGINHALTSPEALSQMKKDKIKVSLVTGCGGVYHPKIFKFSNNDENVVFIGSNNISHSSFLENTEFTIKINLSGHENILKNWEKVVVEGSEELTDKLLEAYKNQYYKYKKESLKIKKFIWREKKVSSKKSNFNIKNKGLIIEITPRETGIDGKQTQIPKKAAREFFGLKEDKKKIALKYINSDEYKDLTLSLQENETVRIMLSELEYDDRPCLVLFSEENGKYIYQIISEETAQSDYYKLFRKCTNQTRKGARKWGYLNEQK